MLAALEEERAIDLQRAASADVDADHIAAVAHPAFTRADGRQAIIGRIGDPVALAVIGWCKAIADGNGAIGVAARADIGGAAEAVGMGVAIVCLLYTSRCV